MRNLESFYRLIFALLLVFSLSTACSNNEDVDEVDDVTDDINGSDDGDGNGDGNGEPDPDTAAVFVLIDEESIDNGNEPNDFTETDVNDDISEIG